MCAKPLLKVLLSVLVKNLGKGERTSVTFANPGKEKETAGIHVCCYLLHL